MLSLSCGPLIRHHAKLLSTRVSSLSNPLSILTLSTSLFLFSLLPSLPHSSSFPFFLLYLTLPLLFLPQPTYVSSLFAASLIYPSCCCLIPLNAVFFLSHFCFLLSLSFPLPPIRDVLIRALSPSSLLQLPFFYHALVSPLFQS